MLPACVAYPRPETLCLRNDPRFQMDFSEWSFLWPQALEWVWLSLTPLFVSETPANPSRMPIRSSTEVPERTEVNDDGLLIVRVQAGDQVAMGAIFDRYATMVYSVALRVLKDAAQAEDVMQEIFLQVWNNPDRFAQGRGSLGAWLAVVARNRSIDILRQRRPTESSDEVVLPAAIDLASEVERKTLMVKVRGVLQSLPQEQQRSLELAYFEGLTHSEIAARTGDPLGTVKTRIRSALASLRRGMEP